MNRKECNEYADCIVEEINAIVTNTSEDYDSLLDWLTDQLDLLDMRIEQFRRDCFPIDSGAEVR